MISKSVAVFVCLIGLTSLINSAVVPPVVVPNGAVVPFPNGAVFPLNPGFFVIPEKGLLFFVFNFNNK